jgi:isochorismate synthase
MTASPLPALLTDLWSAARFRRHPVAIWRRPLGTALEASISLSSYGLTGFAPNLESGPAGFAFSPFQDSDRANTFLLPADVYFDGTTAHPANQVATDWLAHHAERPADFTPPAPYQRTTRPALLADEATYMALVAAGVDLIRSGQVKKVVPSRATVRPLPAGFEPLVAFARLCAAHPRAFVSLVWHPAYDQLWIGASPELLAEVADGQTFRTVALAGTQPATPGHPPEDARWSQKELEEQSNVTRYVIECFKRLRLREYHETGPRTVQAGHLWHLRTDFEVDLRAVPFPTLGTDMLRLLHPTSAVAGMPRETALSWLRAHEGYDRTYYSGFLGPVNLPSPGSSALYVNLRCMQVLESAGEAVLYAGAGLTAASDPAREWAETEQKLRVVTTGIGSQI